MIQYTFPISSLLYLGTKAVWSAENHVVDLREVLDMTDEHTAFLASIEQYVIRGSRNLFENGDDSQGTSIESTQGLALSALSLAMQKW